MIKRDEVEFTWRIMRGESPRHAKDRMKMHSRRAMWILRKWSDLEAWNYGIHPFSGWVQDMSILRKRMEDPKLEREPNLFAYAWYDDGPWMRAYAETPKGAAEEAAPEDYVFVSRARPVEPSKFVPSNAGDCAAEQIHERFYEMMGSKADHIYEHRGKLQSAIESVASRIIDKEYFECTGPLIVFERTGEDSYEVVSS